MKNHIFVFLLIVFAEPVFCQNKELAEKLIREGIDLFDKGEFEKSVEIYDKALEADKDNLFALSEKAMAVFALKKYNEAIALCKKTIELYPESESLLSVYVTCGNSYDALKKPEESLKIYDEGIERFPKSNMLPFNKGITLWGIKKKKEALECFQKSALLKPKHASTHNAIANIVIENKNRISAILALSRFLILETKGQRAETNLKYLKGLLRQNVEKKDDKNITIFVGEESLSDSAENGTIKENYFGPTNLILSMTTALDFDEKNTSKTDIENFSRKFEVICHSLSETKGKNHGFFWEYYAPYFIELEKKGYLTTFSNIVFLSSSDEKVKKWVNDHEEEIEDFYKWSSSYEWGNK